MAPNFFLIYYINNTDDKLKSHHYKDVEFSLTNGDKVELNS